MVEPRDTVSRILAHLGVTALALGCRGADAPSHAPAPAETVNVGAVPSAPTSAVVATAPSASASASTPTPTAASAAPTAPSGRAAPTSSARPGGKVGGKGQPCGPNYTCEPKLSCDRPFNGAGFGPGPGTCINDPVIYEGRPLLVEGSPRTAAPRTQAEGWSDVAATPLDGLAPEEQDRLGEELVAAAFEEHASIAAFARTVCQLMALGAPAWLLEKTSTAMSDEIAHARAAFALATRLGANAAPGALEAATHPLGTGPDLARELFVEVVRGGCVGETLAAHRAAARAEATGSPHMRAFYTMIATDEARHAALALQTARWLLEQRPDLRAVLDEEVSALEGEPRGLVLPLVSAVLVAS